MRKLTLTMEEWNALALAELRKQRDLPADAKPTFYRGNKPVAGKDTVYGMPTAVTIEII